VYDKDKGTFLLADETKKREQISLASDPHALLKCGSVLSRIETELELFHLHNNQKAR
jgi:hypothetical protein